jgi:hypothetical protein
MTVKELRAAIADCDDNAKVVPYDLTTDAEAILIKVAEDYRHRLLIIIES